MSRLVAAPVRRLAAVPARRIAALLALAVVAVTVAACAPAPPAASGGRHPWTQPHVLRLADVADPDSLNPLLSTMDLSYDLS